MSQLRSNFLFSGLLDWIIIQMSKNALISLILNSQPVLTSHLNSSRMNYLHTYILYYVLDAVGSSGILKAKQKLGVTFNFDKQDVIDFTKFSKMTMCRASETNS